MSNKQTNMLQYNNINQNKTTKFKKVQLIRPPMDDWYNSNELAITSFPVGLCILASAIRDTIEVEIIDGLHLSIDKIEDKLDGDLIGVTNIYGNHLNSLNLLKIAKIKGAKTIIGGPNVNYLAERILKNHSYVDFAVRGDGENTLLKLIKGESLETIPNLTFRKDNKIITNAESNANLNNIFDLENISHLEIVDIKKPVPISSIRGCMKAERDDRCIFCSMCHRLQIMQPELVWQQINILNKKYGFNYFFETGDTFRVGDYPKRLLKTRPKNLENISFRVYMCPNEVDEDFANLLCKLNVKEVVLGVESFNDKVLEMAGKSYRRKDIENAINLLEKRKITLHVPFMYGLPNETEETALETFNFAKKLINKHPHSIIIASHFAIPLPGSKLFNVLVQNEKIRQEYHGDLYNDDFFDYKELVDLLLKYYTKTSYNFLLDKVLSTIRIVNDDSRATSFDINR